MSTLGFLKDRFIENPSQTAIVFRDQSVTYGTLLSDIDKSVYTLTQAGINAGDVVVLYGDYSPLSVAMMLALTDMATILVPITPSAMANVKGSLDKVSVDWTVDVRGDRFAISASKNVVPKPELYKELVDTKAPGLVLFTSGSSGKPKAVVHNFSKLLVKFETRRTALITINFLLFDHWGGLNTLYHCLSNLCLIVIPEARTPESVCKIIEMHKVELLPTTPSFLSMLVISRANERYDLSSLKIITYGAEAMPGSTLKRLNEIFSDVDIRQTYGMIELGVLRAKTKSPHSLWMKMGGKGYDVRVIDGILQIKAESAMLGYIDAPSPYTEDGYFITGDRVEVDGEWMHVLGRESDLINIGGEKAYPAEIETVLFDCEIVDDALVFGEKNLLLGQIVAAQVVLKPETDVKQARTKIINFCKAHLKGYMVPSKISFVNSVSQTGRGKRQRRFT
jgi:acyl-coenzyme A synthetase/AMP-(fatty) acid ligase